MVARLYALRGGKMAHEWTVLVTGGGGGNVKSADEPSELISDYKPTVHTLTYFLPLLYQSINIYLYRYIQYIYTKKNII